MTATNFGLDGFDSPEQAKLLGVVDEIRALGISKEISLPQLVVVGDQSSGKSSLLEGLTGIKFPTHSGLCTRFATRIILRRSNERYVRVSIIPGDTSANDAAHKEALAAFKPDLKSGDLLGDRFIEIMDEVAVVMGLPPSTQKDLESLHRRFSDDVFSIELSGSEHPNLSVVDVPGLFHNTTSAQKDEDVDYIRTMIKTYMKNKRTIMLTVMDAVNNFANQEVFRMATDADKIGDRTVGVITKCDRVGQLDEEPIMEVARNKAHPLHHGWFAVRNLSTYEKKEIRDIAGRHAIEEAFFRTTPWSGLSRDRVGVPALKAYLSQILYVHIRKEFPQLRKEIRVQVVETQKQVEALGESRKTPAEQRNFLTRLANQYQIDNTEALKGNYKASLQKTDPRRLRMHIVIENETLTSKVRLKGHKFNFKKVDDRVKRPEGDDVEMGDTEESADEGENLGEDNDFGYNSGNDSKSQPQEDTLDIYEIITAEYRNSRGDELPGVVNSGVLMSLFRQQAAPWASIAKKHLDRVVAIIARHMKLSCQDLIADDSLRQLIDGRNIRAISGSRDLAHAQLDTIIADELAGILQTNNNYYVNNVEKIRRERLVLRLKNFLGTLEAEDEAGETWHRGLNLDKLVNEAHLTSEEAAIYEIHDTLKAYYKVAMKRFVDNVTIQVTERLLLGPDGPLRCFSPEHVGQLSDEDLRSLAGETMATTTKRERLTTLLQKLQSALELADNSL